MLPFLLACASPPVSAAPAGFWEHWGDGKAEIASYDLTQPRYGEPRDGKAVMIFVTEDFSWSARVKADPGEHPDADVRKVLKLNATRDFQTGIYPYHVMTSVFARVDPGDGMRAMEPLKVAFSATEWCGMVYEELVPSAGSVTSTLHTYFDGDDRPPVELAVPEDVLYGDAVPFLVRGLGGDLVPPGGTRTFPWVPPRMDQRFAHTAIALGTATVSRAAETEERAVPAGTFRVERWSVAVDGGATTRWYVEAEAPRRIVAWESDAGESAVLRGVDRLPYWELNEPGDEANRARVGL